MYRWFNPIRIISGVQLIPPIHIKYKDSPGNWHWEPFYIDSIHMGYKGKRKIYILKGHIRRKVSEAEIAAWRQRGPPSGGLREEPRPGIEKIDFKVGFETFKYVPSIKKQFI